MKRLLLISFAGLGSLAAARAQTHVVKAPETVVRAVAVYEWTGEEGKPSAMRLVPVSIFIDGQLQDAGVYLARPVPFALDRGTIFEGQKAGVPEGTLELASQRHLQPASDTPYDDGWLGYGVFKPKPQEPVYTAARQTRPLPQVVASENRPHFANKGDNPSAASAAGTASTPDDQNRPTMQRRTDSTTADSTSTPASTDSNRPVLQKRSDSTETTSSGSTPANDTASSTPADDDPHRPVLTRRSDSANSKDQTTTSTDSTDETDRPTLKKRTPAQSKQEKRKGDQASVTSVGSLNDDPDRPTLHRGTTSSPDIPPLNGLPADMHQMVVVSDAKNRPEHDFARPWDDEAEQADVLAKMQTAARAKLATYDMQPPAPAAPSALVAPVAKMTARTKKPAPAPAPAPAPPTALTDESLRGYTLSYGGAATFVYMASSPGAKGATRYVSVVAQREPLGDLKFALASVTDSTHLDRMPWMRLVDVVDAEASNRASLLFELRAQNSRQFALYRVIGARTEQIFSTGTTQ